MNERKLNHIYYASLLAIVLVVLGGIGFVVYHKMQLNRTVNKEYVDDYFKDVFKLLGEHTATWDKYIQANEVEKYIFWNELDSIRKQLNMKLTSPEIMRGEQTYNSELFINTNL